MGSRDKREGLRRGRYRRPNRVGTATRHHKVFRHRAILRKVGTAREDTHRRPTLLYRQRRRGCRGGSG
jgi:hypothetical protein